MRECTMPSATLRSLTSDRSSPALKCSPSPLMTTARVGLGQIDEGRVDRGDQAVVDRIALVRAIQAHVDYRAVVFDQELSLFHEYLLRLIVKLVNHQ